MRYLKLAAAAAAVAVLTACGGSAEPAAAPPPPTEVAEPAPPSEATEAEPSTEAPQVDACALVPKEDAEKLAGTRLEDAVPVRETCTYTGPTSGPLAQVEVYVGDGAKKILDVDRDLDHEFETLSGIGDEAYLEDGAVFFQSAGVWVAIRLVRLDDPAKYDKPLTELARTVAGRL
ncbi:hypothetical protein O3597_16250 [Verrucosispora sp. WMMA2044]|uniref:DUF3558 domain-containing protein n=1 Tax=Verrucosispora sioxanthis TaxID=2499994 RepID=A0A6M1KNK9_9ACTN|nr:MULTISPECIES: hypothetical protein [Micromonospora]NEE62388.1 hypothetical protein [Verrucosispora sioxanthis]NGM11498.1 hypothetical protein [Verrucosispora sioxanthis]WBB46737.1 hypothetical protein O3597_16250 [Verrucosispora sp. WMMA2044]